MGKGVIALALGQLFEMVRRMQTTSTGVSTHELWMRLFEAPTIDGFLAENSDACTMPSFADYIAQLCEERDEKPEHVINRSHIERSFGHRLFSGARNPSRDTVLQLAFGFEMSADEAQQLLKVARLTPLHPKVKRDTIIAYCLYNGKQLMEAQRILHDNDLPIMGKKNVEA